jgi:hypothetical protein
MPELQLHELWRADPITSCRKDRIGILLNIKILLQLIYNLNIFYNIPLDFNEP